MRNLWNELRAAVANADPCDEAAAELAYPADDDDANECATDAPETAESDGAA